MIIRIRDNAVEIEGYVNSIERLSKTLHDRIGQFVERIKVGAFRKALSRAEDVRILLNHDYNRDLGGISDGNLELYEDAIGLHARATITDPEVVEKARDGKLRGWSFGFTDRDVEMGVENGQTVRNVKDLDLYEVSLIDNTRVPAYDGTLVAVRTEDKSLFISDLFESDVKIERSEEEKPQETEETEEAVEERAEEEPKEEDNQASGNGADYNEWKKIFEELKGEKG